MQAVAIRRLAALVSTIDTALTAGAPMGERDSWSVKLAEARAVEGGGASPMIAAEAAITGESVEELAAHIIAEGGIYAMAAAAISGIRRRAARRIEEAAGAAEIDAALSEASGAVEAAIIEIEEGSSNA